VDPITARRVLRIFPDAPLTADLIERAHAGESAARHPSRYPDGPDRAHAEEWMRTLGAARGVLLAELAATAAHAAPDLAATVNASPKRGLSRGAVIGIVAGAVALVLLVVGGAVGITALIGTVGEATRALETEFASPPASDDTSSDGDLDVDHYAADETFFTFPAAMEIYSDGRYSGECPVEYVSGCWQAGIITEAGCDALQVQLGFSNDPDAFAPEHTETMEFANVIAGETTPVVFGHDDYESGWLTDVLCLD
jgi:hypothetical protein